VKLDKTYTCAHCGGTFDTDRPDEEAQQEALDNFGVRGDAPAHETPGGEGMAVICDDCYQEFMAWFRQQRGAQSPGARRG